MERGATIKIGTETNRGKSFDVFLGRERSDGSYWVGPSADEGIAADTAEEALDKWKSRRVSV